MLGQKINGWWILIILALAATACQGNRVDKIKETAESGEITVYTALPNGQVNNLYLPAFQERYPDIKINLVREPSDTMTARILAEKDGPQADLIWGLSVPSVLLAEWEDILKPYAPLGLTQVDPRFTDTNFPPHWVGLDARALVFCVNRTELEKQGLPQPTTWEALLDPVYKGHIAMPRPTTSGAGDLWLAIIMQIRGEVEGWEYVDRLHPNLTYVPNPLEACRDVGKGRIAIGISFAFRGAQRRTQQEEPVDVVFPTDGVAWDIEANALIKKETIKPAAETFLDWAISDEAIQLYAQQRPITAIATDEPIEMDGFPPDARSLLFDQDFPWMAANRARLETAWETRYGDSGDSIKAEALGEGE